MGTCETGNKCLEWITEQLPVREKDRERDGGEGGMGLFLDFSLVNAKQTGMSENNGADRQQGASSAHWVTAISATDASSASSQPSGLILHRKRPLSLPSSIGRSAPAGLERAVKSRVDSAWFGFSDLLKDWMVTSSHSGKKKTWINTETQCVFGAETHPVRHWRMVCNV